MSSSNAADTQTTEPAAKDGGKEKAANVTKQRLSQLIGGCSAVALTHAATAVDRRLRAVWAILFIIGLFGFLYNMDSIVKRYLRGSTMTETEHTYDFQWPDIVICNPSAPVPFTHLPILNEKWESLQRQVRQLNLSLPRRVSENTVLLSTINNEEYITVNENAYIKISQMFLQSNHISFESGRYNQPIFNQIKHPMPGFRNERVHTPFPVTCFRIDVDKHARGVMEKTTNHSVSLLTLTLFTALDDYLKFNSTNELRGVRIYIAVRNHSLLTTTPTIVRTGIEATFEIEQDMISQLPSEKCRDDHFEVEYYDATFTKSYVFQGGFYDCRDAESQSIYLRICGCYNPHLPIIVTKQVPPKLCYNISIYNSSQIKQNVECLNNVYSSATNFSVNMEKCEKYAKPLCKKTVYTVSQRLLQRPDTVTEAIEAGYRRWVNTMPQYGGDVVKFLAENMVELKFLNERKYVRHITERFEYGFSSLLSDFGGLLGLWLGLSFVSGFEILEILCLFVVYFVKKLRRRKSKSQGNCEVKP